MKGRHKLLVILKTSISLLAGAAVPAFIVAACLSISWWSLPNPNLPSDPAALLPIKLTDAGALFLLALAFTDAPVVLFGVPALLLGIRLRAIGWWSCILVSLLIGFLPWTLMLWLLTLNPSYGSPLHVLNQWPFGVLGIIGGLSFWLLWRFWVHGRPEARAETLVM